MGQYRNMFNSSESFASIKEVYSVPYPFGKIKVRLVHAGSEFSVRVFRLDGKSFEVIAADGNKIVPIEISELIVGIADAFEIELLVTRDLDKIDLRVQLFAECEGAE